MPQSGAGVARLRGLRRHLPPVSVLPAARRGNRSVWTLPEAGRDLRRTFEDPLHVLCSAALALDLSAPLPLGLLPSVPTAAPWRGSGLFKLEGSLPGLVSHGAQLVLPWEAWARTAEHQGQV